MVPKSFSTIDTSLYDIVLEMKDDYSKFTFIVHTNTNLD